MPVELSLAGSRQQCSGGCQTLPQGLTLVRAGEEGSLSSSSVSPSSSCSLLDSFTASPSSDPDQPEDEHESMCATPAKLEKPALNDLAEEALATGGKIYAVAIGREPGLYRTWAAAQKQVCGYPGNRHRSFKSKEAALAWLQTFSTSSASTGSTATSSVPPVPVSSSMKKRPKTENGSTPQHRSMHTDRILDSILHHPLVSRDPAVRRIISQAVKEELQDLPVQQLPSSSFLPAADTSASTSAHKRRGAGASRKFKSKRG